MNDSVKNFIENPLWKVTIHIVQILTVIVGFFLVRELNSLANEDLLLRTKDSLLEMSIQELKLKTISLDTRLSYEIEIRQSNIDGIDKKLDRIVNKLDDYDKNITAFYKDYNLNVK